MLSGRYDPISARGECTSFGKPCFTSRGRADCGPRRDPRGGGRRFDVDRTLDRLLTSRIVGFPLMWLILAAVFWLTIAGANVPSALLASILIDKVNPLLHQFGTWARHAVVAVGIPVRRRVPGHRVGGECHAAADGDFLPDLHAARGLRLPAEGGVQPRSDVPESGRARQAGAHDGMGFGCNAAGVVATRVIDSPRERLVAIITNNFSLCNGRWPTQILIATIFLGGAGRRWRADHGAGGGGDRGAGHRAHVRHVVAAHPHRPQGRGVGFSLELPPYRPPRVLATLYTSLVDRTLFVLWRAVVFARPPVRSSG